MRLIYTLIIPLAMHSLVSGQITVDFENMGLEEGEFLNGSQANGSFDIGPITLPNTYNSNYDLWFGWAISSMQDTVTPGFSNQYSAITGSGNNGSVTYATAYDLLGGNRILLNDAFMGNVVSGIYVTNATYSYLSMKNGDGFAKKFGGEDGNDPDFYLLTIKKYLGGDISRDSVNFYLADYRFTDNTLDYLVDDWTFVDLTALGPVDSLAFFLSSSDNGQFGINTPTYFCIDDIMINHTVSATNETGKTEVRVYPNPSEDYIWISSHKKQSIDVDILDLGGKSILKAHSRDGRIKIDLTGIQAGYYFINIAGHPNMTFPFIKT